MPRKKRVEKQPNCWKKINLDGKKYNITLKQEAANKMLGKREKKCRSKPKRLLLSNSNNNNNNDIRC